jgi:hypothetical protein
MKFEIVLQKKYVLKTENDDDELVFDTVLDALKHVGVLLESSEQEPDSEPARVCEAITHDAGHKTNKRARGETKALVLEYIKTQIDLREDWGWKGAAEYAGVSRATAEYHIGNLKNQIENYELKKKPLLLIDPEDAYRPILNTNTRTNYDGGNGTYE